jgi:hypothetical protein
MYVKYVEMIALLLLCNDSFLLSWYIGIYHFYVGNSIINSLPSPSLDSNFISPPCAFTISYASESPKPVPCPVGLVVKKGWKILSFISGGMPGPLSFTQISTCVVRFFVETKTWVCRVAAFVVETRHALSLPYAPHKTHY